MTGCSFDVTCFSIHGELRRGCCQIWCPKTCHLACLLRPLWHLGDHRAMQGDLGAHGRRPWGSRLGFLSILEGFRSRHLNVFGQLWHNNCVFWHACLQVTFFKDFGVSIWMSGAPEPSIWCGRYCKKQLFTYVGIMSILVSFLHGFRWLWDQF